MIRQWMPDCWAGDTQCTCPEGTTVNSWNWQLMTSGKSQMLATRNFGDWHTAVGEVPWSSVPKTTMDRHSKFVLHSLRNNQPVQVVMQIDVLQPLIRGAAFLDILSPGNVSGGNYMWSFCDMLCGPKSCSWSESGRSWPVTGRTVKTRVQRDVSAKSPSVRFSRGAEQSERV